MTDFDQIKAETEVLAGMLDAQKVIGTRMRDAERRAGEAEAELNALLKLSAWTKHALEQQQAKLQALRKEAEQRDNNAR
jgi:hypothetical protein